MLTPDIPRWIRQLPYPWPPKISDRQNRTGSLAPSHLTILPSLATCCRRPPPEALGTACRHVWRLRCNFRVEIGWVGFRGISSGSMRLLSDQLDTENLHGNAMNHFSGIYKVQTPGRRCSHPCPSDPRISTNDLSGDTSALRPFSCISSCLSQWANRV
jgi:hypothetical protein